jgi:hypothetical protein
MDNPPAKPKRSGSEMRQATARVTVRLTPEQRQQLAEWANSSGVTCGSYARAKLFAGKPIRAVRVPSIERQALAQLLAQLGRLNGNVYQISRAANFGEWYEPGDLKQALKEITELRNAVLAALGREAL